jgi:hypothetical protein
MKKGYIYRHIRLDKNEVFYIGYGGFNKLEKENTYKRAYSLRDRNKYWYNITNNTQYIIEIMMEELSIDKAIEKEIELISLYGRLDLKKGTLVNMTDGGEGNSNSSLETRLKISKSNKGKVFSDDHKLKLSIERRKRVTTDETKEKISKSNSGKKHTQESKDKIRNFNKGKVFSDDHKLKLSIERRKRVTTDETKEKMSESHKGKTGKKHTQESKDKISNSLSGKVSKKRVKIICLNTGEIYNSIIEASNILGISNIHSVLSGKRKHTNGYIFEYYND